MNKLNKFAYKITFAFLSMLVGAYLLLALINLKDENLNTEVQALFSAPPQVESAGNGYFAWIGIMGPEKDDPHVWGQRWFQEVLANDKAQRTVPDEGTSELAITGEQRAEAVKSSEIPCDKIEACLETVAANPDAARNALQKGWATLVRGGKAMGYPDYQESWRPDSSIVSHFNPNPAAWRSLTATRFALAIAEGRHDEALGNLGQEIAFHERQMAGATGLLNKLLAMNQLQVRYALLNQYMVREPVGAKRRADRIASLLALLPKEATSLQASLQHELRAVVVGSSNLSALPMLLDMRDGGFLFPIFKVLGRPLYLPHATANEYAEFTSRWLRADGLTGDDYRQAIADARIYGLSEGERSFTFRNPVGHAVGLMGRPDYGTYFRKRDDLLALHGLVTFQLDLLKRGISDSEAIAQVVLQTDKLIHAFSGDAATWDKETRSLGFPPAQYSDGIPDVSPNIKAISVRL